MSHDNGTDVNVSEATNATDPLISGDVHAVLFDVSMPEGVFAMFVSAIVLIPLYARTGSPVLPAVVLVLLSGSMIPLLPAALVGVARGVLWIAGAAAVLGVIHSVTA